MVLGFSLAFNINAYSSVYCVDVKIEERIKNFNFDYAKREIEFFYISSQSKKCMTSYKKVSKKKYNNLKNLFNEEKIMVINIWASWCVPCRKEHHYIKKLSNINNLKLVGLNYKDKTKNAQKFLEDIGNPFDIILSDTDGTKSIFLGAYGVPETLILDSELTILKKYIGPINSKIVSEIKNLAK